MSDISDILVENAARLFADHCSRDALVQAESGVLPATLWRALEEGGYTRASLAVENGGVGFADMMALVKLSGHYAAPVPFAETLLAGWVLTKAGIQVPQGPLAIAPAMAGDRVKLFSRDGKNILDGSLRRVPWARHARAIAVVADNEEGRPVTVLLEGFDIAQQGSNYAGEPRDMVLLDGIEVPDERLGAAGMGADRQSVYVFGALMRSVMMAGAMSRVLDLTVRYAGERVQFGRAIGKFQAVQQQLAILAGQTAAAEAAADAAVEASAGGPASFQVAIAKARVGEAAGIVAAIAHQVHGAMGVTYEHSLHFSTRRLWSWRDEFGKESQWAASIGRVVAQLGGDNLWPFLTDPSWQDEICSRLIAGDAGVA